MKVPKLKLPKLSKKSQKYVIYFVIVLVVVLVGAFLYFKSGIVNFNIEHMSAAGYKGNTDLLLNDAKQNVEDIRAIVNDSKKADEEKKNEARKEFNDIVDDKLKNQKLYDQCGKDKDVTDCSNGGTTGKYLSGTNGTTAINAQGSLAGNLISKWYPPSATSQAMASVKKLNP
jgi:hypothetical protein